MTFWVTSKHWLEQVRALNQELTIISACAANRRPKYWIWPAIWFETILMVYHAFNGPQGAFYGPKWSHLSSLKCTKWPLQITIWIVLISSAPVKNNEKDMANLKIIIQFFFYSKCGVHLIVPISPKGAFNGPMWKGALKMKYITNTEL